MGRHRLHIRRLKSTVRVGAADASDWARRIERSMTGAVPRAMGRAVDRHFGAAEAVIRIDRLQLRLDLQGDPGPEALGAMLAQRLIAALARAPHLSPVQMREEGVLYWPDRASYGADYVRCCLGLLELPDWAFPDFTALRHLTPAQAATEALVAGGAPVLAALAGQGVRALPGLTPPQIARVLGAVQRPQADLPSVDLLTNVIAVARRAPALAPHEAAVWIMLTSLASEPALANPKRASACGLAVCGVIAYLHERAARTPPDAAAQAGPAATALGVEFTQALATLRAAPPLRRALAALDAPAGHSSTPPKAAPPKAPAPASPDPAAETELFSPHAGVALILPLVAGHLPEPLRSPRVLRAVAGHLLTEEAPLHEATAEMLFPVPIGSPLPAPCPPPIALPAEALAGQAVRPGPAGWADLLLWRFASGLSGLQASSRSYLRAQFLERPGRIILTDKEILVTLAPLPLGIVLQMAGTFGARGGIPHLNNRTLVLAQEGGV